jgi:arylsulfatase A-like enzyme
MIPITFRRSGSIDFSGNSTWAGDRLREIIFAQQQQSGLIPPGTRLTARPKEIPAWDSLSADQKQLLPRQMEVFAGYVAHTDHEIGRLIDVTRQGPRGNDTLVIYIAGDNGADGKSEPYGRDAGSGATAAALDAHLNQLDALGSRSFLNEYSAGWAWAMDTPFQWMK